MSLILFKRSVLSLLLFSFVAFSQDHQNSRFLSMAISEYEDSQKAEKYKSSDIFRTLVQSMRETLVKFGYAMPELGDPQTVTAEDIDLIDRYYSYYKMVLHLAHHVPTLVKDKNNAPDPEELSKALKKELRDLKLEEEELFNLQHIATQVAQSYEDRKRYANSRYLDFNPDVLDETAHKVYRMMSPEEQESFDFEIKNDLKSSFNREYWGLKPLAPNAEPSIEEVLQVRHFMLRGEVGNGEHIDLMHEHLLKNDSYYRDLNRNHEVLKLIASAAQATNK